MATDNQVHFYGAIEKFDATSDGFLMVTGIASTESVDNSGEIVTAEAMRKALPSYLQSGSVREMHQPIAAGCPIAAHVDDDGKTHFTAKIVDVGTINKIKNNVLKGFSVGGKCLKKAGNKITEILLNEISVVDLPCNGEAVFTLIKFDKPGDKCDDKECKTHTEAKDEGALEDEKKKKKNELEKTMNEDALKKLDSLATMVESLAKTVETLSKQPAPDLKKFEDAIGDLQKKADDAIAAAAESERGAIVSKMQSEGRVAFNEEGVAYKPEELKKMDLPLLKMLSRNAQQIPTIAKATYSGTGGGPEDTVLKGRDGKALTGDALVEAGFLKAGYGDLNKMIANATSK